MKKLFLFLSLFGVISFAEESQADPIRFWPGYIDNSGCAQAKECGHMVNIFSKDGKIFLGGNKRLSITKTQDAWRNGTGANSTHAIQPRIHVHMTEISGNQTGTENGKYGVYLRDGKGNDTRYRLKGFPYDKNIALNIRAWLCNVSKDTYECKDNGEYFDYQYTLAELINGSYSEKAPMLKDKKAISWLEVWVNGNDYRLASDNDGYGTRSLHLPGLWAYISVDIFDQYGTKINTDNSGGNIVLIREKIARLNHRQCKLTVTPDKPVYFGNLSVTDEQVGQIGPTVDTRVELSCPGTYTETLLSGGFSSKDNPDPTVNVWTSTPVSGEKAVHVVEEMTITAGTPVTINGEKKIGLTLQENSSTQPVPNPNIYVEGSLSKTAVCGKSNNPLPLDVNLKQHSLVQSFQNKGEPGHAIGPQHVNTFYWKLCKKNGEVEGGKYKGTATISIKYK